MPGRHVERERAPAPRAHDCRRGGTALGSLAAEQAVGEGARECGERAREQSASASAAMPAGTNRSERPSVSTCHEPICVSRPAVVDRQRDGAERRRRRASTPPTASAQPRTKRRRRNACCRQNACVLQDVARPPPEAARAGRGDARLDGGAEQRVRERRLEPARSSRRRRGSREHRDDEWRDREESESDPTRDEHREAPTAPSGIAETR